jgi:hypothetical protein
MKAARGFHHAASELTITRSSYRTLVYLLNLAYQAHDLGLVEQVFRSGGCHSGERRLVQERRVPRSSDGVASLR